VSHRAALCGKSVAGRNEAPGKSDYAAHNGLTLAFVHRLITWAFTVAFAHVHAPPDEKVIVSTDVLAACSRACQ
jgi:hypothetical protein